MKGERGREHPKCGVLPFPFSPFIFPHLPAYLNSFTYSPYPSASSLSTGMNRSDAEFMQ
jgi:hypothetical protein